MSYPTIDSESMKNLLFSHKLMALLPTHIQWNITNNTQNIRNTEGIKNIAVRGLEANKLVLSYLPKGKKCELNSSGKWSRKNRQTSNKAGKILKEVLSFCGIELGELELKNLVDSIKANLVANIEVLEGNDIIWAYYEDNNNSNCGTLSTSCMRHESCQNYIDWYSESGLQLAVIKRNGLVSARALLWTTTDDTKIVDRIYGTDSDIKAVIEWAKNNGYLYKQEQSYSNSTLLDSKGNENTETFYVNMASREYDFPYMDTFKYYCNYENKLSNYEHDNYCTELTSTDGGGGSLHCHECGSEVHEDGCNHIEGEPYCCDCSVYSEHYDESILTSEAVYTLEGCWILQDDSQELFNDEYAHKDDALELYDGTYCHDTEHNYTELYNGEYCLDDDDNLVELCDGEYALRTDKNLVTIHTGEYALISE